jgi:hypothetical protein
MKAAVSRSGQSLAQDFRRNGIVNKIAFKYLSCLLGPHVFRSVREAGAQVSILPRMGAAGLSGGGRICLG